MTAPIDRRAARVLLLDAKDRLLLFLGRDPANAARGQWWFTPGGGLDPGETSAQGAVRELYEETGLVVTVPDLGDVVHRRVTTFPWGPDTYRQEEEYFLLRVEGFEVDTAGFNALENEAVIDHRWWPRADLAATAERIYPSELLELLP